MATKKDFHWTIIELLTDKCTLDEWHRNFVILSHNIHKTGDQEAQDEANWIESYMAPALIGLTTKESFIAALESRITVFRTDGYTLAYSTEVYA